jgi:hypothetical protein
MRPRDCSSIFHRLDRVIISIQPTPHDELIAHRSAPLRNFVLDQLDTADAETYQALCGRLIDKLSDEAKQP